MEKRKIIPVSPETKSEIESLVCKFQDRIESYQHSDYQEESVRVEFINPFFKALGWDTENKENLPETLKPVIHIYSQRTGETTRRPDYAFRYGREKKFFVEAKRPGVDIFTDKKPAYQARLYSYNERLPITILTNFRQFAVYDYRITKDRPEPDDRPEKGRREFFTFDQYLNNLEFLTSTFSYEAAKSLNFDLYVEETPAKIKIGVDDDFLNTIESWRKKLALDLARNNRRLKNHELNFAVQATIDRIIFLRMAEDRGIEPLAQLQSLINGHNVYKRLFQLFQKCDDKYNSGLFNFKADQVSPNLKIEDKTLMQIIDSLYGDDCPYIFAAWDADILGSVYERFLGKVIHLTPGHQARVEDKPEVKKAKGVFYTPKYIVEYIVKNTVDKLIEGKSPKQISAIKIVDPACGSGSFLVNAYQHLLDYHLDYYMKNEPLKHEKEKRIMVGPDKSASLLIEEKKRILLNNIFGVDLDPQAVEVTKLSLLLKVLENEDQETISYQQKLFYKERALPDLDNNIKCGNSLIGTDFFKIQQASLFEKDDERRKINAFDWEAGFPEIFKNGGFDVVIGNPPYVRMETFKELKSYLKEKYASHDERSDLYAYFIEKAHNVLNKSGRLGMIVSNKFLRANYGVPLRKFLSRKNAVEQIVDFAGLPVFKGATVRTIVLIISNARKHSDPIIYSPPLPIDKFYTVSFRSVPVEAAIADTVIKINPDSLEQSVWTFSSNKHKSLLDKIKSNNRPLSEYCDGKICMGIKSGLTQAFMIDKRTKDEILKRNPDAIEIIKPFLNGRDVRRYFISYRDTYIIYTYHGISIKKYPAVEKYLLSFKNSLQNRATKQNWYELQQPQHNFSKYMDGPKIIFPDIATSPRFSFDDFGYYSSNTTYFIPVSDYYLLGILNSSLADFYFKLTCAGLEGKNEIYLRFFGQYLENFPVCDFNQSDPSRISKKDKIIALTGQMLALNKQLFFSKTPDEKSRLEREIKATDGEIDRLVYELYGLTEEEIKIVERES